VNDAYGRSARLFIASETTLVRVTCPLAAGSAKPGSPSDLAEGSYMRAGERGTKSYDRGPDREQRVREAHRQSSETMNCNGGSSVAGEACKAGASVDSRPIVTCEFRRDRLPRFAPPCRADNATFRHHS